MANLCLGTAQLGMAYGINNKVGKLDKEEVFKILDSAIDNDIKVIDTASIYGEAEKFLGEYFKSNAGKRQKVSVISKQCDSVVGCDRKKLETIIRKEFENTLNNLCCDQLDGYLLHSYNEIANAETIEILSDLKREGLVAKIGVSLYDVEEAKLAIALDEVDYIQMPFSIFDQRGLVADVFVDAKRKNKTVFTRSAFLQGLLMMKNSEVPEKLEEIIPYIEKFDMLLKEYNIEKRHAVVRFVIEQELIDYMVFGVESISQLEQIVMEKDEKPLPVEFVKEIRKNFSHISEQLILPINWK